MSGKTVFISYRRDTAGRLFGRSLKQELTRHGYDVFFDVDSMDPGKWEEQIRREIPARDHFLLLLTPNALDRCNEENDWLRREFELASQSNRNIVPIREESVEIGAARQSAPKSMEHVFAYNIANVNSASFEDDVQTLISRYIVPHKAPRDERKPESFATRYDINRIIKYAPAELIGREGELKLLNEAWDKTVRGEPKRPHILTFVALGGEGKTSLVAKWAAELAHQDWPGCEAAFAWSFYSQGTSEKTQASSDTFLRDALIFFGDEETANSARHAVDKAKRLAELVGRRRSLLILDGLEPLQYAPTSPTGSELKDQGVSALLKALATSSKGVCLVTTRYSIPDLRIFQQSTAPEIKLTSLSIEAGIVLLRSLGVKGTEKEFEQLVKDVRGHALTLNLLGSFLRDAHAGDIRKSNLVKLEDANAEEQSGHAFHVMDAYVTSLKNAGKRGTRALSILRLLGLFDRPATADCLNVLWSGEEIGGLSGPLIGINEAQRNIVLKRLEEARLITVNREQGSNRLVSIDAHPLLREYFAVHARNHMPGAWRAAHRRLYEHLVATTNEGDQPTLEDLQPLYQAVSHGCQAGLYQEVCERVYHARILRRSEHYSWHKLGAFGLELGTQACFFSQTWIRVVPALSEMAQAWLTNEVAFCLQALGRLSEAVDPMRAGLPYWVKEENWEQAAIRASNLSNLELTLGELARAVEDSGESVNYADHGGDGFFKMYARATHADTLHQTGSRAEADRRFREAEQIQTDGQPYYPLLYSVPGHQYCDLLLTEPERAAWQQMQEPRIDGRESEVGNICLAVRARATQTLTWVTESKSGILGVAVNHLTLARIALYVAILSSKGTDTCNASLASAVDGFRRAGQQNYLPHGLLTRAWLRFLTGARIGFESAQEDLDEAWEIAERGPMRLHMADIHLYRARLFHAVKPYPWNRFEDGNEGRGPKDDLADARKLIERCGYWRRKEELEDAEEAAKGWD